MDLTPPAADEAEVSVFGPGFGESICVHLGDGEWAIVDSCLDRSRTSPAALTYLRSLGVHDSAVRLVVASHWHDDHVRGISEIVRACSNATVVCSAAVRSAEFIAFVQAQERSRSAVGSGVDEFREIIKICLERRRSIMWAKANLPLHPLPPGDRPAVVALSPSEDAFERALIALVEAATDAAGAVPRYYHAPEGPNGASVATWVRSKGIGLLLGADLERSNNPDSGWDAVIRYCLPADKASALKVPHHGSEGAHHEQVWQDMLEPNCLTIITPWVRGGRALPLERDLERIVSLSSRAYITVHPDNVLRRRKADALVKKLHGQEILQGAGWGHVRARRRPNAADWRVDLDGDAQLLAVQDD